MKDGKTANAIDARIRELVEAESPYLTFTNDDQKIVCVLNNHEIPVRLEALEAFVRGKKYARLKRNKSVDDWTDVYRPFLVPSVNFPNMMFCSLTNHVIKKTKETVEGHLKGKKFKRAQERFQNDQLELYEEPTIEEMEQVLREMEEEEEEEEEMMEFEEDASVHKFDCNVTSPLVNDEDGKNGQVEEANEPKNDRRKKKRRRDT